MSLKDLFKNKGKKFLKPTSKSEIGNEVESSDLIGVEREDQETFIPHIDFAKPENFARYGSAKKYYTDAFTRIADQFPYDGTIAERTEWFVSSSYIDKWVYENKYPRTNGHVSFSPKGWGTRASAHEASGYTLGMPENKEYILIKGGPHTDSDKDYKKEGSKSNIHDADKNRLSNLRLNPASGSTVEFWLKVDALPAHGKDGITDRMTLFDLWNGVTGSSDDYGRFEIYINNDSTGSNAAFGIHAISGTVGTGAGIGDSFKGFNSVSASAANEGLFTSHTQTELTDGLWHHYAFVLKNSGSNLISQLYVDGTKKQTITKSAESLNEIKGKMIATIGANVAYPEFVADPGTINSANGRGLSKFSGSMDEFRYWKDARDEKEIGRYWFTQVGGGTNREDANVDLGVYYKFNEGIVGDATDSTVLDYSGRISNGTWTISTGMTGSIYRLTGSAMVQSGKVNKEYKDPIIHENHSDVVDKKAELETSGSNYDTNNLASIYKSVPDWIVREDAKSDNELENLTQIMASYFDTLHLQMESLPRLKEVKYHYSSSNKPYPFNDRVLENFGFNTADMFYDEDFIEHFSNRDEDRVFRESLSNIKNIVYNNIYNNLVYIYKTKGTQKSFRNLIRCFGVDEEFIKLNMYASDTTYTLDDSYRTTSVNKPMVNFSSASNNDDTGTTGSIVYQYTEAGNSNSTSYIYGSSNDEGEEVYVPTTTEAEIVFPLKPSERSIHYISHPHYSSSLFGCRTAAENSSVYTVQSPDYANFTVYSVRKELDSTSAYFQLTGTYVSDITSSVYENVYDNEKWNFGVRFRLEKEPWANKVSGTYFSGSEGDNDVIVEFYGVNTEAGVIKRQFSVSGTLDDAANNYFFSSRKRFFAGADRTNFTGDVITPSDVRFSSLRHWMSNINDDELIAHALDIKNYGASEPFRNAHLFETPTEGIPVPKIETLALNWDFSGLTGSNSSGQFTVQDISSGSADRITRYGWLGNSLKKQHTGRGYDFPVEKSGVISKTYVPTMKQTIPENLLSSETVKTLAFDDEIFTRDSKPVNYFFAFEKSPYQNISEEMLNIFATIKDFNNLIGEPVNRYRQKYKDLEKLRNLFFERVANTPDVEKYVSFYKWLDSSISEMLANLIPATANFAEDVRTIIESHVLERNKYWTKFPTMEFKTQDPEASIKGASELNYDWKHGHAPITQNETDNCLWWKERAERDIQVFDGGATGKSFLSSSDEFVNLNKKDLLQVLVTETSASNPKLAKSDGTVYQGSGYGMRRLTRPYKLETDVVATNQAVDQAKKSTLWKTETKFNSGESATISSTNVIDKKECNDKLIPEELEKHKYSFKVDSIGDSSYLDGNGSLLAPFSMFSSSVTQGYIQKISTFKSGVDITDIHTDSYFGEEPLQGPFAEKYVGGQQHRHVDLNTSNGKSLDTDRDRPEAYHIDVTAGQITIKDPSDHDVERPRARYYRNETAKRPVNIRNIQQGTGSIEGGVTVIGNYDRNYQVVQIPGRDVNNLWFRSGSTGTGGIDESRKSSEWVSGTVDFRLPEREKFSDGTTNKTVIAERFSSPGGPEQMSRGFLDVETETHSIYNTMNYRNTIIRQFVDDYSAKRCEQFGVLSGTTVRAGDMGADDSYENNASWHKVNRNTRHRVELASGRSLEDDGNSSLDSSDIYITGAIRDNAFVQHMIPRSDRQYAWITASVDNRVDFGKSAPYGYSVTQDGLTHNYADDSWSNPFTWVTASEVGSAEIPDFSDARYFGAIRAAESASQFPDISERAATDSTLLLTDFAGINSNIYEPLTESSNTLGYENLSMTDAGGAGSIQQVNYINQTLVGNDDADETTQPFGISSVLNSLLLHRNGPGGYPTWKQVRAARHPVARDMRKNNRISLITSGKVRGPDYSWPDNINPPAGTAERTMTSYTEPVVSFKSIPMAHHLKIEAEEGDGEMTLKHTYTNNLTTFANKKLVNDTDAFVETKQVYDHLVDLYTPRGGVPFELNPVKGMKSFTYSETVFPKDEYAGLAKTRSRTQYAETSNDVGSNGRDRKDRRTFWRDKREDRGLTENLARNSQGNIDNGQGRPAITGTTLNVWPLGPIEHGDTMDSDLGSNNGDQKITRKSFFGELWPSGTYESVFTTASLSFMRSIAAANTGSAGSNAFFQGSSGEPNRGPSMMDNYSAHIQAGKNPWYDSYEDYSKDIKLMGQGYSILPEFKISDHIDYYVSSGANFLKANNKALSLDGANITSSAGNETGAANKEFYETYSHSDFMQHFGEIAKDHQGGVYKPSKISLKFSGIKKLLPYNGFYPALRSLQLGSLLSQSIGPSIGGSSHTGSAWFTSWYNGAGQPPGADGGSYSQQRLNSLLQPFFAPGIFFNSIKSGIAVDYPIFKDAATTAATFNMAQYGPGFTIITDSPNYRLPFESLVDLKNFLPIDSNIRYIDPQFRAATELNTNLATGGGHSDIGLENVYFTWDGTLTSHFEMASHNFLGETVRFFLKDESLKKVKSKPQKEFKAMLSGSTYYMDIVLRKTEDFVISQGSSDTPSPTRLSTDSEYGSIYGPGYRAPSGNGNTYAVDPCYAPHTPPYFYGTSTARIAFKPHVTRLMDENEYGSFTLQEIINSSEITFFNSRDEINKTYNSSQDSSDHPAWNACMEISSSINMFGIQRDKIVEFEATQTGLEEEDNSYTPIKIYEPQDSEYDSWVISPKWECPALNVTSSNTTKTLSIWNRYGHVPSGSSGIFFEIKESYPDILNNRTINSPTQSLIDVCGFEASSQRIGELAEEKEISEAIVAIPYSTVKQPGLTIQKSGFGNKHFYRIEKDMFNIQKANVEAGQPAIKEGQKGSLKNIEETSISKMIKAMKKYVFPPKLDFLRKGFSTKAVPIAMYIFEFTHTLDKEDLSDIWQNLMPKIAMKAEKQDVVISHDVSMYDFFGPDAGPFNPDSSTPNVRWMIFKVKRKAEQNYYSVTADTTDDDRFRFDFGGKVKKPDYSYNWPYDFFSLVELARMDTAITFEPTPTFTAIAGSGTPLAGVGAFEIDPEETE